MVVSTVNNGRDDSAAACGDDVFASYSSKGTALLDDIAKPELRGGGGRFDLRLLRGLG